MSGIGQFIAVALIPQALCESDHWIIGIGPDFGHIHAKAIPTTGFVEKPPLVGTNLVVDNWIRDRQLPRAKVQTMRQVGSLANENHAHLFADYLVAQGISAHAEMENELWAIWVKDENHLAAATESLEQFIASPSDQRFQDAPELADQIRRDERKRREKAKRNLVDVRAKWAQGSARKTPAVVVLIAASVLVLISGINLNRPSSVLYALQFRDRTAPNPHTDPLHGIKRGQVWRLVTPIFLHGGIMNGVIHLLFNMYWLFHLGGQIEARKGAGSILTLMLVLAIGSNVGQALINGPYFGGMSGVNYGLFGFVWMKSRYEPSSGFYLAQSTIFFLVAWFFLCIGGFMGPIANTAHAVGLGSGMAIGYAPVLLRDVRRR